MWREQDITALYRRKLLGQRYVDRPDVSGVGAARAPNSLRENPVLVRSSFVSLPTMHNRAEGKRFSRACNRFCERWRTAGESHERSYR
jgi:hypothetical protein